MADKSESKSAQGPGLMTLIKAAAFVSVIVLLQIAAASMLIPSAEETTAIADRLAAADYEQEDTADAEEDTSAEESENQLLARGDMVEVSLGAFHVLFTDPETGSRTNVDFDLFATVLDDEESEFFDLYAANEQRIREQVLITLRGTDMTELADPTLGLIKRKILEKVNRALGRPLMHEVIFSKYSFEER